MSLENITFRIFTDINELPKDEWRKLETDSMFSHYEFLKNTAISNPGILHHWVFIYEKEQLAGGLYFQIVRFRGAQLKSYLPEKENSFLSITLQNVVDCFLDNVDWKLAVLGNIFISGDNGQHWSAGYTSAHKWQLVKKAARKLQKSIQADAVLITDIYNHQLAGSEVLENSGFRMFEVEPDMIFKVNPTWTSFDGYLQSISSKYRVRANKVLEKSSRVTVENASAEILKSNKDIFYSLYKNVVDKADFKLAEISENYLWQTKENFPDLFEVKVYSIQTEVVGFISYFINNDSLEAHIVGLDYSCNKDNCIYQRILYDCIADGIQHQKSSIHFGRTAGIIKSAVGANPIPVYSFLKHHHTLPNMAIKPLTRYLKPEPFIARNPYKENLADLN
jgi:predicted N-acyltransferase